MGRWDWRALYTCENMQATSPCANIKTPALTQSYPTPAPKSNVPVPFRELHPLARVRALRTMADRHGIDRYGFDVLTALSLRMDETGSVMVSQVRVATEARCSERTVRNRLKTLERNGFLMRRRSGPRGLTRYQLATPTTDLLDPPTADRHQQTLPFRQADYSPAPATTNDQTGTPPEPQPTPKLNQIGTDPPPQTRQANNQTGTSTPNFQIRPARWFADKGIKKREIQRTHTREQTGTVKRTVPYPPTVPPNPSPNPSAILATLRTWRARQLPLPEVNAKATQRPISGIQPKGTG